MGSYRFLSHVFVEVVRVFTAGLRRDFLLFLGGWVVHDLDLLMAR